MHVQNSKFETKAATCKERKHLFSNKLIKLIITETNTCICTLHNDQLYDFNEYIVYYWHVLHTTWNNKDHCNDICSNISMVICMKKSNKVTCILYYAAYTVLYESCTEIGIYIIILPTFYCSMHMHSVL